MKITQLYMFEEFMQMNMIKYDDRKLHLPGDGRKGPSARTDVYNDEHLRKRIYSFLGDYQVVDTLDKKDTGVRNMKRQDIIRIVSQMNVCLGGDPLTKHARKNKYVDLIGNNGTTGKKFWLTKSGRQRNMCPGELRIPKIMFDERFVHDFDHSTEYVDWKHVEIKGLYDIQLKEGYTYFNGQYGHKLKHLSQIEQRIMCLHQGKDREQVKRKDNMCRVFMFHVRCVKDVETNKNCILERVLYQKYLELDIKLRKIQYQKYIILHNHSTVS